MYFCISPALPLTFCSLSSFIIQRCELWLCDTVGTRLHLMRMSNCFMYFSFPAIKTEREYEMKRLTNLQRQENTSEEVRGSLRGRKAGLRRPLPPKSQAPASGVCPVPCVRADGGPETLAVTNSVQSYDYVLI